MGNREQNKEIKETLELPQQRMMMNVKKKRELNKCEVRNKDKTNSKRKKIMLW